MTNRNEERADRAFKIIDQFSDRNYAVEGELVEGMYLDITDIIADLLHLGDRYRLNPDDLLNKASDSYEGDIEDGPHVEPVTGVNDGY